MRSPRNPSRHLLGAVALVASALALNSPSAYAATSVSWNATDTSADVVGAHAWGSYVTASSDGEYTVTANIKDTKADSHGARVNLRAACEGSCVTLVSVSASGLNATAVKTFTLKAPVTVQECLTEAGVDYICGEPHTIVGH